MTNPRFKASLAILLGSLLLWLLPVASVRAQTPSPTPAPQVMEIHLDGIVHPISADFITGGMQQAIERRYALILLQVNTPGGLDDSMRQIINKIIQSPVPVVVFVAPSGSRAASAGFFILLSADIAAMAPGTNTGAAHPVLLGGQMDDVMKQKVENDAAAYLRSIAGKRGRNVELAQTGVTESKSFTEEEALEGRLIDLIAPNRAELLSKLDGYTVTRFDGTTEVLNLSGVQVEVYNPSFRQSFLSRILDPNIAFILLILGVLGLYVEFSNPGLILPGVAGGIALILALFAFSLLPVNWAGAALIFLAIVFFVLEAKFATSGILAAGGVLAMVLGALMLINTRLPGGSIALTTALSVALPFALITVFLLRLVIRARSAKVATGISGMVGELGRAETAISLQGKVYVHGELWDAFSSQPIPAGAAIRVKSITGMTLEVEPVSRSTSSPVEQKPQQQTPKGA
ncbi:MAG: nodulation protein NfeD [Acidobacteria bacterium]|nr:nodulation protein NfeD [Acidobacteriota bacterium]